MAKAPMPNPDGIMSNEELGDIILEGYRWQTGFFFERWLINRRRRKEGKAPFTAESFA